MQTTQITEKISIDQLIAIEFLEQRLGLDITKWRINILTNCIAELEKATCDHSLEQVKCKK